MSLFWKLTDVLVFYFHHAIFFTSDPFGPPVHTSFLPGTPMIDTISEVSQSFESGFNSINLNDRRSSVNGTFDDTYYTFNTKIGILQRFTELESMHPSALERKMSFMRHKKFTSADTIKEISPDSGQGGEDDVSLYAVGNSTLNEEEEIIIEDCNSAERRASKQDVELTEDPDSLYFRDGRRQIDMILCFEEEFDGAMTEEQAIQREKRKIFQENLIKEGLDLEVEDKSQSFDEKTYFVKIHLPWRTESRYAEVMNLKLPVKRFITISVKQDEDQNPILKKNKFARKIIKHLRQCWKSFKAITMYDFNFIEREPSFYSATDGGKREEQFVVKDRMTHYTNAQRSGIVFQILLRAKYDDGEKCGIRRLLNDGTYLAFFPLHEGRYDKPHTNGALLDRMVNMMLDIFS